MHIYNLIYTQTIVYISMYTCIYTFINYKYVSIIEKERTFI